MRPGIQTARCEQLAICTAAARTAAACPPCASAAGHANQRCRTYSKQRQRQAPFSVLRRSPVLHLRTGEVAAPSSGPNQRASPGYLLGACKTPHAPIYCTKRSEASTPSPRPFFSSGSSLSGYASAATGSPGHDVNDPEAGRQHSQSRGPHQGSSPGTHKERGLAAPDFLGEVFFVVPAARLSLSALICLSAVASRSSGAQEQQDLDPPSNHAMGAAY